MRLTDTIIIRVIDFFRTCVIFFFNFLEVIICPYTFFDPFVWPLNGPQPKNGDCWVVLARRVDDVRPISGQDLNRLKEEIVFSHLSDDEPTATALFLHLACITHCFEEETIFSVFIVAVWTVFVSVAQNVIVYAPVPSFAIGGGTSEPFESVFGGWTLCKHDNNNMVKGCFGFWA